MCCVHLLFFEATDELVMFGPELPVDLLMLKELSGQSFQMIVQVPLSLSGHQIQPIKQCCNTHNTHSS